MDSESAAAALPPGQPARRPIGEFLVERGLVTPEELAAALAQQRLSGQRLGEILVERGCISRMALASVLGEQWEEAGRHLRAVVPVRLADGKEADTGLAGGLELTESLAALQTAVARLEDLAGETGVERPSSEPDASMAADVLVRLERLEALLREEEHGERLAAALETFGRDLAEVRAVLAEPVTADTALTDHLGRIEVALESFPPGRVEERLAALDEWLRGRDDEALGEQVTAALAQLRERIEAVENAVEAPAERFDRLEALLLERGDDERDTGVADALAEVHARLESVAGLRSELEALRAEMAREPAPDEQLHARIGRIEQSLTERADDESLAAAVAEVRALVESRPATDPAVSEALAGLHGRLDRLDEVRDALAELRGVVGREPARDEELHARLIRIEESLAERANDEKLAAAVDALAGLRSELGELRGLVGREPSRDEELHARLGRIEESLAESTADGSSGDELVARALAELRTAVDRAAGAGEELQARLGRIEAQIADGGLDERTAARLTDLREALERAVADDDGLETTLALSTLSDRLVELRAAVDRPDESLAELRERLDRIDAALSQPHDDGIGERLHALTAGLDELRDLGRWPNELDPELMARLERIENLVAQASREPAEELLERLVAALREELQAVAAAADGDHGGGAVLEAIAELRSELAAATLQVPDAGDIAWRVGAALASRLEGLEGAVRDALAAPSAPDADDVASRVTVALDGRLGRLETAVHDRAADEALADRIDRVGAELRDRIDAATPPVPGADEIAGRVHDAIAGRLDGIEAAVRDHPVPELVEALAGRLEEIKGALDRDRDAELAEQLGRIESELRAGLAPVSAAVGGHAQQLESLAGTLVHLDGELLGRLEQLVARLDGVETAVQSSSPDAALAGLGERIDGLRADLAEPRDGEVRDRLDRLESAVRELPAAAREVANGQEAVLQEVRERIGAIEGSLAGQAEAGQVERLEQLAAELRAALVDPPGAAALSRLVAQSHNALAERLASFEHAAGPAEAAAPTPATTPGVTAVEPDGPTSFVALVPSAEGYRLVDVTGLLPARGATLEVEGVERVVARLGRSPLPGDRRRCAFLEAV